MGITKEFFHFSTKYKNTIVSLFLKTVVFWLPPPCAPLPPPPATKMSQGAADILILFSLLLEFFLQ